jgi:acyl transferase domain-containing protein
VPPQRFNAAGFYHPDSSRPGSLPSKGGYFLQEDIRSFDNAFFGINNLEARYIDPQQRKLLEVVYECFESGGQTLERLKGSNTGCFVANFTNDFTVMQYKDAEYASHYSATGSAASILANRVNHAFNLLGPTLVVDTACSGSLYSLHLACTALQNGDCDSAVVAGANLIQSPELFLQAVKAGILSTDSTCHTYDASANGYGRAEGAGALYVKRLSDARRDGDPVRAVIRGTALNRYVHPLELNIQTTFARTSDFNRSFPSPRTSSEQEYGSNKLTEAK